MAWVVETLNDNVDAEIEELSEDLQSRFARIIELIAAFGLEQIHEPYVKHLDGKLWEMRAKAKDGIARGIYITASGQRVIILHVFVKKTQKTPKAALNLARQRMKEAQL